MPPNVFIGHATGDTLPASDWNSNWLLVESSFADLGSYVITGLVPSAGTGLSVNVSSGTALVGAHLAAAGFVIGSLAPSTTNYLYLLQTGVGTSNTTGVAPAASVFLGTATTSGSAVTAVAIAGRPAALVARDTGGHVLLSGGSAPTAAAGANAGSSPPAPVVTAGANDSRGSLTWGTGTDAAAGAQVGVTFAQPYASAPIVVVVPLNAATAALLLYVSAVTAGGFTLAAQTVPTSGQSNTTFAAAFLVLA
jgi:hypothetical protein